LEGNKEMSVAIAHHKGEKKLAEYQGNCRSTEKVECNCEEGKKLMLSVRKGGGV